AEIKNSTNHPTQKNSPFLNSHDYLYFDGVDDYLIIPDTFNIGTIFIVAQYDQEDDIFSSTGGLLSALNGGNSNSLLAVGQGGTSNFYGTYFSSSNQQHNNLIGTNYTPFNQW